MRGGLNQPHPSFRPVHLRRWQKSHRKLKNAHNTCHGQTLFINNLQHNSTHTAVFWQQMMHILFHRLQQFLQNFTSINYYFCDSMSHLTMFSAKIRPKNFIWTTTYWLCMKRAITEFSKTSLLSHTNFPNFSPWHAVWQIIRPNGKFDAIGDIRCIHYYSGWNTPFAIWS